MTDQEKRDEITRLRKERDDTLQDCKNLIRNLDYDQTCLWLDMLGKEEISLLIREFSKDPEIENKVLIIKGYYNNKYGKN